jgi:hypothetical protein
MKTLKYSSLVLTICGLGIACPLYADDVTVTSPAVDKSADTTTTTTDNRLYRDYEFDFDLFGTLALNRQTIDHISTQRIYHHAQLGLGAGGTFYFCRYIGVGGDVYSSDTTGSFVDSTSGNVYLRYPILDSGIAPYIFGGGGYDFEEIKQGFGQAGTGIEFRLLKNVGFFVDARYVFAAESKDYGVGRAGFRVSF